MAEKITSEQATAALALAPEMKGKALRFFQALEAGRLPEYYLDNFRAYRSEYLDDLPEVDVRDIIDLDISERMARGEDPGSM